MPKTRIGLYMGTHEGLGAQILRGIVRFAREHGEWSFFTENNTPIGAARIVAWGAHGLIGSFREAEELRPFQNANIPCINISSHTSFPSIPSVVSDPQVVGELAADYFLKLGHTHFATSGYINHQGITQRMASFADHLKDQGFTCPQHPHHNRSNWSLGGTNAAAAQQETMAWLKSAPKPLAIFAACDTIAIWIAEACELAQLRIPDDVSILGVDNDELRCELSPTPLSSIDQRGHQIGYQAATLLDTLLNSHNQTNEQQQILIAPGDIVVRESTDMIAVQDTMVSRAIRLIRQQACTGANVSDIVAQSDASRRTLEKRFRECLGHSLLEEIHRFRLALARQLLRETILSIEHIARQSGYSSGKRFREVFQKHHETSPTEYRQTY